ncbi:MAG: hypothetical protein IBX69_09170, partial [Anaerolineales bacterium]|nr:hypothetical protein [Anaerolineales bacterium]
MIVPNPTTLAPCAWMAATRTIASNRYPNQFHYWQYVGEDKNQGTQHKKEQFMRNRFLSYLLLLSFLISLGKPVQAQAPAGGDEVALLAVEMRSESDLARFEASGLPAYARLQGRQPLDYLLTGADHRDQAALLLVGLSYQVLDADIAGASYYLVTFMPGRSPDQVELSDYGKVLLDDGVQVVLRADPTQAESLVQAGAELRRLTFDPKPLRQAAAPLAIPDSIDPDPLIQSMIDQVDSDTVDDYTG